jgi:hypothetical protein
MSNNIGARGVLFVLLALTPGFLFFSPGSFINARAGEAIAEDGTSLKDEIARTIGELNSLRIKEQQETKSIREDVERGKKIKGIIAKDGKLSDKESKEIKDSVDVKYRPLIQEKINKLMTLRKQLKGN